MSEQDPDSKKFEEMLAGRGEELFRAIEDMPDDTCVDGRAMEHIFPHPGKFESPESQQQYGGFQEENA